MARQKLVMGKLKESATIIPIDDDPEMMEKRTRYPEISEAPIPDALVTCSTRPKGPPVSLACWDQHRLEFEHRVPIRARIHFMELTRVDTVSQQFDCKAWVQLKWEVQAPVGSGGWGNGPADVQAEAWGPALVFTNHVGDLSIDERSARSPPAPGSSKCTAYRRYVIRGTFAEHMELHHFPVDCQRLHIRAVLWDCPEAVYGVPLSHSSEGGPPPRRTLKFELGNCQVYKDNFIMCNEWEIFDRVVVRQGLTLASRNDNGIQYTTLGFHVCLRRKLSFYWWNIVMPIFLLVLISFASFFMDHQALADRLNLTVVVLLTLVAFKFVLSQYIPATSYLTFMDMYIVTSFSVVFLVALQNLVTFIIASAGRARLFNLWSGSGLAVAWLVLHMLLPLLVVRTRRDQDRRWVASDDDEEDSRDAEAKDLERSPL